MAPIAKKNTLFAKVCGRVIMMVDICIQCVHPECSKLPSKENKANSYKWFTEEHFSRLISKLEDVILARVLAPSETRKKKTGKTSSHDTSDILPDPDLLIQYQFVKRRKYKQSVLIRSKQESLLYDKRKNTGQSKYSGGGYESVDYFSEKLKVTVSQMTLDVMPSVARLAQDSAEEQPRKSTISKYFNKGTADMTHSTQKKRAALKNMNKKQDLKKKIDSLLCTTSSDSDEKGGGLTELEVESEQRHNQISWVEHLDELDIQDNLTSQGVITSKEVKPESRFTSKEKGENANGSGELEGEHERRHNPISWVKHLDELDIQDNLESQGVATSKDVKPESRFTSKEKCVNANGSGKLEGEPERRHNQKSWVKELNELDIRDNLACLEVVSLKGAKQECDRNIASRHSDESGTDAFSYSDTCNITSSSSPKVKECTTAGNEGDVSLNYLNNHETVMKDKDKNSKQSGSTTSKLKRPRSDSESDSDSLPSLRSRLASKTFLKKKKTVRVNHTGDKRKESDSNSVNVGEDNDFETPKLKRNVDKRKGSDLSDDQDLCLLSSTHNLPGSSNSDVKEGLCSKKKKPSRTNVTTVQESSKKTRKLVQKKINKRQVKTSSKTTSDVVEDVNEEPGSSPLEPITIEDKPPVALDVSTVEDLTADQTEQLVWEHASELREIFEGKKYCRRHEDYKKGGRMKGDLAFQVQFGQFSEEQRDTIIGVLTAMFCYKHTKYFDYVSKVLLPETLVMLYMKVVGRSRDEAEMSLLERTT